MIPINLINIFFIPLYVYTTNCDVIVYSFGENVRMVQIWTEWKSYYRDTLKSLVVHDTFSFLYTTLGMYVWNQALSLSIRVLRLIIISH